MRLPPVPVVVLMLTQTTLWGMSLTTLGAMAPFVAADLDMPPALVYAGATIMFGLGAATAPACGAFCNRYGAFAALVVGSLGFSGALLVLALSQSAAAYVVSWAMFGLAMNFALSVAAYAAIVQTSGRHANQDIATLTLATGLSSTVYWPLAELLINTIGWRAMCLAYAAAALTIVTGLHLYLARRGPRPPRPPAGGARRVRRPACPPLERKLLLLAAAMAASGFVTTGIGVVLIDLCVGLGAERADALTVASLLGVWLLAGRMTYMVLRRRLTNQAVALVAFAVQPASFLLLALWATGAGAVPLPVLFLGTCLFGMSSGIVSILRPVLLLEITGSHTYASEAGRMWAGANAASAASPALLGFALQVSALSFLVVSIVATVLSFAFIAMLCLGAGSRPAGRGGQGPSRRPSPPSAPPT